MSIAALATPRSARPGRGGRAAGTPLRRGATVAEKGERRPGPRRAREGPRRTGARRAGPPFGCEGRRRDGARGGAADGKGLALVRVSAEDARPRRPGGLGDASRHRLLRCPYVMLRECDGGRSPMGSAPTAARSESAAVAARRPAVPGLGRGRAGSPRPPCRRSARGGGRRPAGRARRRSRGRRPAARGARQEFGPPREPAFSATSSFRRMRGPFHEEVEVRFGTGRPRRPLRGGTARSPRPRAPSSGRRASRDGLEAAAGEPGERARKRRRPIAAQSATPRSLSSGGDREVVPEGAREPGGLEDGERGERDLLLAPVVAEAEARAAVPGNRAEGGNGDPEPGGVPRPGRR